MCIRQIVVMMMMVRCVMWQMIQTIVTGWHKTCDCRWYTNSWWHCIMQMMIVQMIIIRSIICTASYEILQTQPMCVWHILYSTLHSPLTNSIPAWRQNLNIEEEKKIRKDIQLMRSCWSFFFYLDYIVVCYRREWKRRRRRRKEIRLNDSMITTIAI